MKKFFGGFVKRYIAALIIITAIFTVLVNSSEAADAVKRGIEMCLGSVIPSLFPMIFLSQLMIKSGAAEEMGSLLRRPTQVMFGLPGVCGAALLVSMIGGYPSGARAAETLTASKMITGQQGRRMAMFSFCSGPGFTIGLVGAMLYGNKTVGLLILTAQIISSIIIGIALNFFGNGQTSEVKRNNIVHKTGMSEAFVESASDAASTVLAMSSFIIIFCVISEMLKNCGINEFTSEIFAGFGMRRFGECIIPCIIEVTGGSIISVKLGVPFTAFVVGFGGLSVHFQNFAICRELGLNKVLYISVRFIQGILCYLITSAALWLPCFKNITAEAFAVDYDKHMIFSQGNAGFGVIFIIMCFMSVLCLPKEKSNFGALFKGADIAK